MNSAPLARNSYQWIGLGLDFMREGFIYSLMHADNDGACAMHTLTCSSANKGRRGGFRGPARTDPGPAPRESHCARPVPSPFCHLHRPLCHQRRAKYPRMQISASRRHNSILSPQYPMARPSRECFEFGSRSGGGSTVCRCSVQNASYRSSYPSSTYS